MSTIFHPDLPQSTTFRHFIAQYPLFVKFFGAIFKKCDKQGEKDPFWKVEGEFTFSIEPKEQEKKK